MVPRVSVVETLAEDKNEIMEDVDKFIEKLRDVINRVKSNRKDLDDYELKDLGFYPDESDNIIVNLYFVYSEKLNKDHNIFN